MGRDRVLSLDEFVGLIAEVLAAPESTRIDPSSSFVRDLQVDSLGFCELHAALESELLQGSASTLPETFFAEVQTVSDAYQEYCALASSPVDIDPLEHEQALDRLLISESAEEGDSSYLLRGRRLKLRPITPPDLAALYEMVKRMEVSATWRFHGVIPTYDGFVATLQQDVLVQYVSEDSSGAVLGLVTAYGFNPRGRYCYLATFVRPSAINTGLGIEAAAVFLEYLFNVYPLKKVYFEVPGFALKSYSSIIRTNGAREEGRLTDHYFHFGKSWDQHILAVYPAVSSEYWSLMSQKAACVGDGSFQSE